jgi:hypothetical protein
VEITEFERSASVKWIQLAQDHRRRQGYKTGFCFPAFCKNIYINYKKNIKNILFHTEYSSAIRKNSPEVYKAITFG